jgi:hypothetical protein
MTDAMIAQISDCNKTIDSKIDAPFETIIKIQLIFAIKA